MTKLYGDAVREKSGIQYAISEIVSEAVESHPHLKKIKKSASVLKLKAKQEAGKLIEKVQEKATTLKAKAQVEAEKMKGRAAETRFPC